MCLGILDARLGIFQTGISAACIAEILPQKSQQTSIICLSLKYSFNSGLCSQYCCLPFPATPYLFLPFPATQYLFLPQQ